MGATEECLQWTADDVTVDCWSSLLARWHAVRCAALCDGQMPMHAGFARRGQKLIKEERIL